MTLHSAKNVAHQDHLIAVPARSGNVQYRIRQNVLNVSPDATYVFFKSNTLTNAKSLPWKPKPKGSNSVSELNVALCDVIELSFYAHSLYRI